MTTNDHENFEEIEIEHNNQTYYANGHVAYSTTECIGGNYEGYAFEILYEREITDVTFNALWYNDEETGNSVDILNENNYREVERIAEEVVRWEYE